MTTATLVTGTQTMETAARETELRAAARARGLTMRELAAKMGVSAGYLWVVATRRWPWTRRMRERAVSVLEEVPGQEVVYRQTGVVSSYIRERARALGMSMQDLAQRVGVSYGYMSQVSRGRSNMGVKVQARVESALKAPAKVAPSQQAYIDREAVWGRMDAHGLSQNEVARRAGISSSHLSQIMNGNSSPSPGVLKKLHGVLFQRSRDEERVMPAEVKGVGLAEGCAARHGGARRWRGWEQGWRRRCSGRRTCALGRRRRVRLSCGVRRQGPGVGDSRCRDGLFQHVDATGAWISAWSNAAKMWQPVSSLVG